MPNVLRTGIAAALMAAHFLTSNLVGYSDDWPTFRGDQRRSGVSDEFVDSTSLNRVWAWQSPQSPAPAWPDSARWDAYAKLEGLRSMRDYDPVFHPVVSDGRLYFASNADDTLRCVQLNSGKLIWTLTLGAPIRVAPTCFDSSVLVGCDDGSLSAIDSETGAVLWQRQVTASGVGFINDGRLCSQQAIRTGVLVDAKLRHVVVGTGVFPWKSTHLVALSVDSGQEVWRQELGTGWTLEGAMLMSEDHIIAPQGRSPPQLFSRADGTPKGPLSGGGGSFALLTDDNQLLHGPGNKDGWITNSSASSREKIASFGGGTSALVKGEQIFLLGPSSLSALDRKSGQVQWRSELQCPHELIMAGSTLFAGGDDCVAALNAKTGDLECAFAVDGRAIGLAFSDGHLLVSTDKGQMSAFSGAQVAGTMLDARQSSNVAVERVRFSNSQLHKEQQATGSPPRPTGSTDDSLLHHWFFHADLVESDSTASTLQRSLRPVVKESVSLPLHEDANLVQAGKSHALALGDGIDVTIAEDFHNAAVPQRSFTAIAVVRIDRLQPWGGLLSVSQDNGNYEKGWMLGFRGNQFGLAVNGSGGPDRLTWTLAKQKFNANQWYHVAAVYDGDTATVFVNGQPSAVSRLQSGDIDYPTTARFQLGSYRDDDEHFYSKGQLNEVALYRRAMSADDVLAHFGSRAKLLGDEAFSELKPGAGSDTGKPIERENNTLELTAGPEINFVQPGVAEVRWTHNQSEKTRLVVEAGEAQVQQLLGSKGSAGCRLAGIRRNELVAFRIRSEGGRQTEVYECDRHFDYTSPAWPTRPGESERALRAELTKMKIELPQRGIAVIVGESEDGKLVQLRTALGIDTICFGADSADISQLRSAFVARGVYGRQLSVHDGQLLARIPSRTANIVICSYTEDMSGDDISRMVSSVKPEGYLIAPTALASQVTQSSRRFSRLGELHIAGVAMAAWQAPRDAGSAGWTHMYGDANNTAFAGESLAEADSFDDMEIRWCGRPGPRYQSDRGNRKPSPLAAGGRLYLQGLKRLIGMDAHNGTILWSRELPEVVRFNVPRDCSNWCADEDNLFVAAGGRCKVIDGGDGDTTVEYPVWNPTSRQMNWGYVARKDDLLIGTCVQAGASFTAFWGSESWYDAKDGEHAKKICSDGLFALSAKTGSMSWNYRGGLIVNPTISIGEQSVVFVESRSQQLIDGESRRLEGDAFWSSLFIVSVDAATGKKQWETPARPLAGVSAFYGVIADDKYLIQSSNAGEFAMYAMEVKSGKMLWRGKYAWEADHHGKHLSRPAVVGNKVFLRPLTLDLRSGDVLAKEFPVGHQCGTYTASKNALFLRAGSLAMWDGESTAASRLSRVRPDCWISTVPAEGMLLSPEGGGGCSCGGWIETSMGFAPKRGW